MGGTREAESAFLGLSHRSLVLLSQQVMAGFLVGVDVGTYSARAALFSSDGELVRHCSREIRVWNEFRCLEQSSEDIWSAVCFCVKVRSSSIKDFEIPSLIFTYFQSL